MLHMEQKSYKLLIINELLINESHARNIAKNLKTNHMNIVRKLKELLEENVVDFKQEGKNKTYFIKKTIEARAYVIKSENYKLIQILKTYPELRLIISNIQRDKHVKLAVLFGSYSKKSAKKESDIDVYINTNNKKIKRQIESINNKLNVKIGEFDLSSLLAKEIIKNHVIIKGVEEFYEKIKFFD